MERFQEARDKALNHLKLANHVLGVTYPLVKDPKLLVNVVDNLFLALTNALTSVLHYDRLFKQIPPFHDTFESKFTMFQAKCVLRYKIDGSYLRLIQEIKEIVLLHRSSPVEFRRKDRFVICSDNFNTHEISADKIKDYLKKTKEFFELSQKIVNENERIFSRSERRIEAP